MDCHFEFFSNELLSSDNKLWSFERKWFPKAVTMLGDVTLLEYEWHWRKCDTVEVYTGVLQMLKPLSVTQTTSGPVSIV